MSVIEENRLSSSLMTLHDYCTNMTYDNKAVGKTKLLLPAREPRKKSQETDNTLIIIYIQKMFKHKLSRN